MGRPPSNGGPSFRFNAAEVAEMESILQAHNSAMPAREILVALAEKFSASAERSGKFVVQMKQVWNWFQNRRYALRAKAARSLPLEDIGRERNASHGPHAPPAQSATMRNVPQVPQHQPASSVQSAGNLVTDNSPMEFEAKSARDGAWYDVATFLSHRPLEKGDPEVQEVLVRFAGFGPEEDEWVNVRKLVRPRSLPCESSECVAVLPGDLILCFQEGKEQALYFDAHVLDAQRRRHDVRGCRCRFLVRYDHDQSEEIVPLRKVCRRPETDYRLQQLHAVNASATANKHKTGADSHMGGTTLRVYPPAETTPKKQKTEVDTSLMVPAASKGLETTPKQMKAEERPIAQVIVPAASNANVPPAIVSAPSNAYVAPVSVPAASNTNMSPHIVSAASNTSIPPVTVSAVSGSNVPPVIVPTAPGTNLPPVILPAVSNTDVPSVIVPAASNTDVPPVMAPAASNTNVPPVIVPAASDPNMPPVTLPASSDVPEAIPKQQKVEEQADASAVVPAASNVPAATEIKVEQPKIAKTVGPSDAGNSNVPPGESAVDVVSDDAKDTPTIVSSGENMQQG